MAQQFTATQWQNKVRSEFIPNCTECSSVADKETLLACLFNAVIAETQGQQNAANAQYDRIPLISGCDYDKAKAIVKAFMNWVETYKLNRTA